MGITRAAIVGVAVAGCSMAPLASTPYLSPPHSSDTATGFAGMTRALTELRKRRDGHRASAPIALSTTDGNGLILRSIKSRAVIEAELIAQGHDIPVARVQAMHEGKRRARDRRTRGD